MISHWLGYTAFHLLWIYCTAQTAGNDCGPPPRREREELADQSGKESYSHGEEVLYNCRPGYIKLGRIRFQCNNGHWQPMSAVECRKKPCGHPGAIPSGSFDLVNGEEFVFGARVVYQCDEGYQMLSRINYRDCRVDGWSNDVPHCEVKKCFPVKAPENGRISMTGVQDIDQEFLFGQVVRFECIGKFKIQGSDQIFCTAHGNWSDSVPRCVEITCQPEIIDHGSITAEKNVYKEGERLSFTCYHGYKHAERSDATCTRNGWSSRLACIEILCFPPQVVNGNFQPKKIQYAYEETIQTQCEPGYKIQGRESTSTCTENDWSPYPQCISKNCDYPNVENGFLSSYYESWKNYYFPRSVGQTIDYSCKRGFLAANKGQWHRVTCTKFGFNPEPKCLKKCDPSSIYISHGKPIFQYWQIFVEGEEISFSCGEGYDPSNQQPTATCTKNGWSPTPRCVIKSKRSLRHLIRTDITGDIGSCPVLLPRKERCENIDVLNGFFISRGKYFNLNGKAEYGCHSGFTTPQGSDREGIQCDEEGWKPEPKCIKTCQMPPEENMLSTTPKSTFLFKETLNYNCKDGFETIQKTTGGSAVCTEHGWNPKPECSPIQCEAFLVTNGNIQPNKNQYDHREVVRVSCRSRSMRVGPDSTQCYHFGWSPQPPTCKAQAEPCQSPSSISDGIIVGEPRNEYKHGEKVKYECNLRFSMTGSQTVECVDGQWTSLPYCREEVKVCGSPPNITNGFPVSIDSDRYWHGETVAYECNEHAVIIGTKEAKCLRGQWELPLCADVAAKCTRPQNAKLVSAAPWKKQYNNNDTVSYNCGPHHHKTKCVNGKWSPEPECKELCPLPPQLPNAIDITERRNYNSGEEISFRCEEHFRLQGPQKIKCEDGKWQTPPRCIDVRCAAPPAIAHGDAKNRTQEKYLPGDIVEYHCHEGFEFSGPSFTTCENGKWSQIPTCQEKSCGEPPKLFEAAYDEKVRQCYQPGDMVSFKCYEGYTAEGPLTMTCQRGNWSRPSICEDATCREPPRVDNADILEDRAEVYLPGQEVHYQCHEGFEISGSAIVTCRNREWSESPRCEDMTCPPPPPILHGHIDGQPKQRYLPHEKVRYRCSPQYSLFGSFTVTCLDKKWTESPTCKDVGGKCGRPPAIENGDITNLFRQEYNPGATVRYQCQNMYNMEGPAIVRCSNGHWSEVPTCIEPCTATEDDMNRNNIKLTWKYEKNIYSVSGDTTEFSCKWGYEPDPHSPPFRATCVEGKLEYPRCVPKQ